jgi:nicotinamide riboside kinase
MHIFLCGSHSCGKTTLANEIRRRFAYGMVPEAAREVIISRKVDLASLAKNAYEADVFQYDVADAHMANLSLIDPDADVVFDRGIDFLVYASMYSTLCHRQTTLYLKDCVEIMSRPKARVFVLDPHEADLAEDGVRKSLDMATAVSITNGIVLLLEMHNIPYFRLTSPKLLDRIKTVETVIRLH